MSYNGIGLSTARGSGTNGYVTRNLSTVRRPPVQRQTFQAEPEAPTIKKADPALIQHNKERSIAVQCMAKRLELEDQGLDQETISMRIAEYRRTLLADGSSSEQKREEEMQLVLQEKKNNAMKEALGIGKPLPERKAVERAPGQAKRPWLDRGDGPLPAGREKKPKSRYQQQQQRSLTPECSEPKPVQRITLATCITQVQLQT